MFLLPYLHFIQYGDTPLHTAARYGHSGVIRILVSAKCNTSEQNKVSH
jgi:ankyrin repeat protein